MSYVSVDGVQFKTACSEPEIEAIRARIEHSRAISCKLLTGIRDAAKANDAPAVEALIAEWVENPDARLVAAIRANQHLKPKRRVTLEGCFEIAATLDFSKPIPEKVPVWRKPKGDNKFRIVHDHGPIHRTAQHLLKRPLEIIFQPRPFQFGHQGHHRAIRRSKGLIAAGYVHFAHLDIEHFFGSFELEKLLPELPLPKDAVEKAVIARLQEVEWEKRWYGSLSPYHKPNPYILYHDARLGLPTGSACSSIVGAICLAQLPWSPTKDVGLVNFVDDFGLFARSASDLVSAIDELRQAVNDVPGGTFKLTEKHTGKLTEKPNRDARHGITFLGHVLQLKDGEVHAWPHLASEIMLYDELEKIDQRISKLLYFPPYSFPKARMVELIARYVAIVDGWAAAFSECDDFSASLEQARMNIEQWIAEVGVSLDTIKSAITPDMKFSPKKNMTSGSQT